MNMNICPVCQPRFPLSFGHNTMCLSWPLLLVLEELDEFLEANKRLKFLMFGLRCLTLFLKIVGTISFCGLASFQFVPVSKYLEPHFTDRFMVAPDISSRQQIAWNAFLLRYVVASAFEWGTLFWEWYKCRNTLLEKLVRGYDADKILSLSASGRAAEWLVNKEPQSCLKWAAWREILETSPQYF